jgi:hypothetical protein
MDIFFFSHLCISIVQSHSEDVQFRSTQALQEKIATLQSSLEKERQENQQQRQLALQRERELEQNVADYTRALIAAQRVAEEKTGLLMMLFLQFFSQLYPLIVNLYLCLCQRN